MAAFAGPIVRLRLPPPRGARNENRATDSEDKTIVGSGSYARSRISDKFVSAVNFAREPSKRAEREWDVGSRTPASQTREVVRK